MTFSPTAASVHALSPKAVSRKSISARRHTVHFSSPIRREDYDDVVNASQLNNDEEEKRINKARREIEQRRKSISVREFISAVPTSNTSPPPRLQHANSPNHEDLMVEKASGKKKVLKGGRVLGNEKGALSQMARDEFAEGASRRLSRATRKMDSHNLENLFRNCIKLSTENKITAKNTWQLRLIDHMDEVIAANLGESNENFQVASCTLDASIKIYSSRVDSVHSETFKVLSGLSRVDNSSRKQSKDGGDDDNDDNGDENAGDSNTDGEERSKESKKEKKSKKPKKESSTLECNINNLNIKKFEFENTIEPLFHQAQIDVGSARSLLLNNLTISETADIILDTSTFLCPLEPYGYNPPVVEDKIMISSSHVTDIKDSAEMNDTPCNDNVSSEGDDKSMSQQGNQNADDKSRDELKNGLTPDKNSTQLNHGEYISLDADLINMDSSSCNINDDNINSAVEDDNDAQIMGNNIDSNGDHEDEDGLFEADFGANDIVVEHIQEDAVDMDNEFAYFDAQKLKNYCWSGVNHWKFKSKSSKTTSSKSAKKSSKLEKFMINFEDPLKDVVFEEAFALSSSASANTFTEKTIKGANKKQHLLPEDVHYDMSMLLRPFHLTSVKLIHSNSASIEDWDSQGGAGHGDRVHQDQISNLGLDDHDEENDIMITGAGEDFYNDSGVDVNEGITLRESQERVSFRPSIDEIPEELEIKMNDNQQTQEMQLIDAPKRIEKLKIQYETKALKVDVKALKDHLWDELSSKKEEEKQFSSLVQTLTSPDEENQDRSKKKTPQQDFSSVSVPFAFICLLHLANEHGLEIEGNERFDDLSIRVPCH